MPLKFGIGQDLVWKSGRRTRVKDWSEFVTYWNDPQTIAERLHGKLNFSIEKKNVVVHYRGKKLSFVFEKKQTLSNILRELSTQFLRNEYGMLEVSGKDVVDVGAGMGETALYFIGNGARHVYAFEPFHATMKLAKQNIKANGAAKKVTLLGDAIGGRQRNVTADSSSEAGPGSVARGTKMLSLEAVVRRYKLRNAVLKMDCEGCEYGAILSANNETLQAFAQIILEYHYGSRRLARKLEEAGFCARPTIPEYFVPEGSSRKMYMGILYARRCETR